MKKFWLHLFSALTIIILLGSTYLFLPQTFLSIDNRFRDFLFILRGPLPASPDIVIIDIDEKSLKKEGQWPWSRNKVAQLIQNLSDAEVGIIGLDIVFSEPDKSSPHRIAAQLQCNTSAVDDYDAILANTIANTPTIGGYFYTFSTQYSTRSPLIPAVFVTKGKSGQEYLINPTNLVLNIPIIQDAFYSSGFFNNTPDEGGMIRRVPLLMRYDMSLYPSLSLEMVRIYTGEKRVIFNNKHSGMESISMGTLQIPTDRFARLVVNFRGAGHSYKYISAADILDKNFKPEDIAGKFVLIGTSAVGLADLRATPFDTLMPGVEVHASIIDNLINQDFLSLTEDPETIDLLLIIASIILTFIILYTLNVWLMIPIFLGLVFSQYLFFMEMLFTHGIVLNILFPAAGLLTSFVTVLLLDYIISLHQKREIMAVFAKKVSKNVMDDLIKNSSDTLLTPRNKEVTVFFSDIRSFTSISERLADPKRVILMLNTYMTPMVENITKHHGTVDKFIGDAVMAYWNAPIEVQNHADKALLSALEQQKKLKELNTELYETFGVHIAIGIGIHTGMVTIGEMGSVGRSDYTIIGDNVNLASRLEGLNKLYGSSIIISSHTKEALQNQYQLRSLDIVKVKGKKSAVEIFEVILPDADISDETLQRYVQAVTHYRNREVAAALKLFEKLQHDFDSTLYTLYVERCQQAIDKGVENFDPVTTMYSK